MKKLNSFIVEGMSRTSIKNLIYREVHKKKLDGKLYSDDYWKGVKDMKDTIGGIIADKTDNWDCQIFPRDGGYRTSKDGMNKWKEYAVEIYDASGKLQLLGTLNCHAAGSVEDPFDKYDMTLVIDNA